MQYSMQLKLCISLVLFFLVSMSINGTLHAAEGKRLALVIGNKSYLDAPLKNPVNDALAMSNILTSLGFKVITKTDANASQMNQAIREFGDSLGKNDIGLFYFSGHGAQVKGNNYLLPIGATIQREDEIAFQAIDAGQVLEKMESARNGMNIVILDACRNNPFGRSFRSSARGLARMDAPTGTVIVYATAPGAVASDGAGNNGLFTSHLLNYMRTPNIDISEVLRLTRVAVLNESKRFGENQVPWESSSLLGRFCFKGCNDSVSMPNVAPLATAHTAVPSSPIKLIANRYLDNKDGTITDVQTKLVWKKCSEGQSGNNCQGQALKLSWSTVSTRFNNAQWRLPTINELNTLIYCSNGTASATAVLRTCNNNGKNTSNYSRPTINQVAFPNTPSGVYWSANQNARSFVSALSFYDGHEGLSMPSDPNTHVRLIKVGN